MKKRVLDILHILGQMHELLKSVDCASLNRGMRESLASHLQYLEEARHGVSAEALREETLNSLWREMLLKEPAFGGITAPDFDFRAYDALLRRLYDEMAEAVRTGVLYRTRMEPGDPKCCYPMREGE